MRTVSPRKQYSHDDAPDTAGDFARLARLPEGPERRMLRDALVTAWLPMAERIAVRFRGRGEALEDLYQVAALGLVKAVDKAIRNSSLGLNPSVDGQLLRVPLPELTQERRTELVKVAHRYAEQARVAVRNVRRDGMDQLKRLEKDGDISQDEHKLWSDEVQKLTDRHIEGVNDLLAHKEKDILQV